MGGTVAIVGRPNVGKSTLFNRLAGRREALVHDTPGLTRDRRDAVVEFAGLGFRLIDTAGLDEAGGGTVERQMMAQTDRAVAEADVVLFVYDARAGVTPVDEHFADRLRRAGRPVVLVANKCDGRAGRDGLLEGYSLGLGEPVAISAEHNEGVSVLAELIAPHLGEDALGETEEEDGPIRLAVIGRPNAGKSTLVNRLLGEERTITGPEPGVTRDAIAIDWSWRGRPVRLIDTAGLRRRSRIAEPLERLSVGDTLRAIRFAHAVILMVDATAVAEHGPALERQDLTLGRLVVREGRALVVAVNKWDLIDDKRERLGRIRESLDTALPQAGGVAVTTISAETGAQLDRLMDAVLTAHDRWNSRVATGALNRWLEGMLAAHAPPIVRGRRIKIRYATQVSARPPSFALFTNQPGALPAAYLRYLENGLREAFGLGGVPIRFHLRKGDNPYA